MLNGKMKSLLFLLLLSIALEFFFSNMPAYLLTDTKTVSLDLNKAKGKDIRIEDEQIVMETSKSTIALKLEEPVELFYVTLQFYRDLQYYVGGQIGIKDESRINKFGNLKNFYFNPGNGVVGR